MHAPVAEWHTRRIQNPVPHGLWVQVPPGVLMEKRQFVFLTPGLHVAWSTVGGYIEFAPVRAQIFEVPHNGCLIGVWAEKPSAEAVREAYEIVTGNAVQPV